MPLPRDLAPRKRDRRKAKPPKAAPPRAIPITRKPAQPGTPAATRHRRFEQQKGNVEARLGQQRRKATSALGRQPRTATERQRGARAYDVARARRQAIRQSYRPDVIRQLLAGQSPGLPGYGGIPGVTRRQAEKITALGLGQRERAAAARPDSLAGSVLNPVDIALALGTGGTSLGARALARAGTSAAERTFSKEALQGASEVLGRAEGRTAVSRGVSRAGRAARGGVSRRAAATRTVLRPANIKTAAYNKAQRAAGGAALLGAAGAGGQQALVAGASDVAAHASAFKENPGRYISRSPGGAYGILAGLGTAAVNVGLSGKRLVFHEKHPLEPAKQAAQMLVGGTIEAGKLYASGDYAAVKQHAKEVGAGELLAAGIPLGHAGRLVRPFRGKGRSVIRTAAERARAQRTDAILKAADEGRPKRKPGKLREELGLGVQRRPTSASARVVDQKGRPVVTGEPERVFPIFERHGKRKPIAEVAAREEIYKRSLHDRIAKRIMLPAVERIERYIKKTGAEYDLGTATSAIALLAQKVSTTNGAKAIEQLTKIVNRSDAEALGVVGSQPYAAAWLLNELHDNPNFIRESGLLHATAAYKKAQLIRKNALQRTELLGPRGELVQRHAALKPIMFEHGVPPAEQRVAVEGGTPPTELGPAKPLPTGTGRPLDVLRHIQRVENRPHQFMGKTKPGATGPSVVKLREEVELERQAATSEGVKLHRQADTLIAEANVLRRQSRESGVPRERDAAYRKGKVEGLEKELRSLRGKRQAAERKAEAEAAAAPETRTETPASAIPPATPRGREAPPHLGGTYHAVDATPKGGAGFRHPVGTYFARARSVRKGASAAVKREAARSAEYELVKVNAQTYTLRNLETGATRRPGHAMLEGKDPKWRRLEPGEEPKAAPKAQHRPPVAAEGALGAEKARVSPELTHAPEDYALYVRKLERQMGMQDRYLAGKELGLEEKGAPPPDATEIMDELVRRTDRADATPDAVAYAYLAARDYLHHSSGPTPKANAEFYARLERGDTAPEVQDFAYEVTRGYLEREEPTSDYTTPFDTEPAPGALTSSAIEGPPRIKDKRFEGAVSRAPERPRGPENLMGERPVEKPTYGAGEQHEAGGLFQAPQTQRGQTNLGDAELGLQQPKGGLFDKTERVDRMTDAELEKASPEELRNLAEPTTAPPPAPAEGRSVTTPAPGPTAGGEAAGEVATLSERINELEKELRATMRKQALTHTPTRDALRKEAQSKRNLAKLARRRANSHDKKAKALSSELGRPMGEAELTAAINEANVIRRAEEIGTPAWVHQENAIKVAREAGIPMVSGGKRGGGSRIFRRGDLERPHGVLEALGLQDSSLDTLWARSMSEPLDSAALEQFHMAAAKKLQVGDHHYTIQELSDAFASGELNPRYVVAVPDTLHAALSEGRRQAAEDALFRMRTIRPDEPIQFYTELSDVAAEGARSKTEPTFTLWDREGFHEYRAQLERSTKTERVLSGMNRIQAAAVLSTSLAWVPYQLVAEGAPLLASTSPHRWAKLAREFNKLPIRAQAAIDAYHGSYGFGLGLGKPEVRLRLRPGQAELLSEAHKTFNGTKFGRAIRDYGAPWGWLRHIDAWKGEQFRNIMALEHMRKAMDGLWRNARGFNELEGKILEDMKGRPFNEQIAWYTRHPDWMESMGSYVKDMLGDWNTLSSKERIAAGLGFFYNMIRYTTRFVFWTFPKHHPLKAGILFWLGNQNTNNVRRLLGGEPAYISALMQALVYSGTDPTDPSQVGAVNVARASPGGQALVQAAFRGPFTISTLGLAQPALGIIDSAIHGTDPYSGSQLLPEKAIQAKGYILQPDSSGHAHREMLGSQKGALFLSQILRLPAGIRNLEDAVAGGRQTGALPFTGKKKQRTSGQFGKFYEWALPTSGQKLKQSVVPGVSQPLVKQRALSQMQDALDQITYAKEIAKKGGTGAPSRTPADRALDRKVVKNANSAARRVRLLLQYPARYPHG